MINRFVVTGSECTGKTTLAAQLAERYGVPWVPEYSREYAALRNGVLDASDVEPIARGQRVLEDSIASGAARFLIQDTDLLSTVVYSHHYYGSCPGWIEQELRGRLPRLYLLLYPDVPWIGDGIRDRGHMREDMHGLFVAALRRFEAPYVEIRGDWKQRMEQAVRAIDTDLLAPGSVR